MLNEQSLVRAFTNVVDKITTISELVSGGGGGGSWTPVEGSGTADHGASTKALVYPEEATMLLIGVNYHGLATSVIFPLTQYDAAQSNNFVMLGSNGSPLDSNQIAAKIRIDAANKKIWVKAFSAVGDGWSNGQAGTPVLTLMYQ